VYEQKMQVVEHQRFGNLRCLIVQDEPWFYAKDLATTLEYKDARKAVAYHVKEEQRCNYKALQALLEGRGLAPLPSGMQPHTVWVNEAGMYSLVLGSKLEAARAFKLWVCEDVLPSIRKHGFYVSPQPEVANELELHNAISRRLHNHHPGVRLSPGLGEYQVITLRTTEPVTLVDPYRQLIDVKVQKRESEGAVDIDLRKACAYKGYQGGQPDLIIHQRSGNYSGLALELKTPKGGGLVSPKQEKWLQDLRSAGYRCRVCDKLEEAVGLIDSFLRDARVCCWHCGKSYKSQKNLSRHLEKTHPNGV
jgi:prophage antirepressor-like protein